MFQLLAYLLKGITIAVFSLLDLIVDMFGRCERLGILTTVVCQYTSDDQLKEMSQDVCSNVQKTKLILTTPESLQKRRHEKDSW